MELIIKIDKELYEAYKGKPPMLGDAGMDMIAQAIANGTPITELSDNIFANILLSEINKKGLAFEEVLLLLDKAPSVNNPKGDLISREALKEEHSKECIHNCYYCKHYKWNTKKACGYCDVIDNAPPVEAFTKEDMAGAYNEGYACGSRENTRPQGDLISREALRSALEVTQYNDIDDLTRTERLIDNAPPVDAYDQGYADGWKERYGEPDGRPKGEWINREAISNTIFPFWERYECNQCHKFNGYSKFCPNCGADMRGTEK